MSRNLKYTIFALLFAVLMSIPFLVPHCGWVALFAFIPLLCLDRIATIEGTKKLWRWHYPAFVLWNLFTTFWVCNASIGGGIFAVLANALKMSLIFGLFRLSKKYFKGVLPYIFLAATWIAWEHVYFNVQISWPWLVLGNAFARTTHLIQWYEYTGSLGGSLWIWACNLGLFGIMCALSDGSWNRWNGKARIAALTSYAICLICPMVLSVVMYKNYKETSEPLEVAILQPNIDPYHKFQALTQDQQNAILEGQFKTCLADRRTDSTATSPLLVLAPETFTNDIIVGEYALSKTWRRFRTLLSDYKGVNLLFGASATSIINSTERPSYTARQINDGIWRESHNSAIMMNGEGKTEIFHKSKLVVGVEMTPYPRFYGWLDDKFIGGVMGRCVGQDEISLLHVRADSTIIPIGCAICYESVFGEYCTGYVRKGAKALTVITNDAWWGNTPGYRQHMSYASLRAIETRRDIARCANTGISGFINQRGDVLEASSWWEPAQMRGEVNLNDKVTFFVANGDIVGRLCCLIFALLALGTIVRIIVPASARKN